MSWGNVKKLKKEEEETSQKGLRRSKDLLHGRGKKATYRQTRGLATVLLPYRRSKKNSGKRTVSHWGVSSGETNGPKGNDV